MVITSIVIKIFRLNLPVANYSSDDGGVQVSGLSQSPECLLVFEHSIVCAHLQPTPLLQHVQKKKAEYNSLFNYTIEQLVF